LLEVSAEERAEFESLVAHLSPESIQAAFRAMNNSLEEIIRSPLPRASLEMALARLSGLGQLKSLEDLLASLQGGVAASSAMPEKKSPETVAPATVAVPIRSAERFSHAVAAQAPPAPAKSVAPPAPAPTAAPPPPAG